MILWKQRALTSCVFIEGVRDGCCCCMFQQQEVLIWNKQNKHKSLVGHTDLCLHAINRSWAVFKRGTSPALRFWYCDGMAELDREGKAHTLCKLKETSRSDWIHCLLSTSICWYFVWTHIFKFTLISHSSCVFPPLSRFLLMQWSSDLEIINVKVSGFYSTWVSFTGLNHILLTRDRRMSIHSLLFHIILVQM